MRFSPNTVSNPYSSPMKYLKMLPTLTYDPSRKPKKPTRNIKLFFISVCLKTKRIKLKAIHYSFLP